MTNHPRGFGFVALSHVHAVETGFQEYHGWGFSCHPWLVLSILYGNDGRYLSLERIHFLMFLRGLMGSYVRL